MRRLALLLLFALLAGLPAGCGGHSEKTPRSDWDGMTWDEGQWK